MWAYQFNQAELASRVGLIQALCRMTRTQRWVESSATSAVMVLVTFGLIAITTLIFGDKCWPPRFGGLLVGIAVFVQAYVYANQDYFSQMSKYGLTREQRVLHKVYVVTVFGTLLWAFGDFAPSIFGVPTCKPS